MIFAAENALYGAGYDIGKADGWLDETLRAAIRQYQTDTRGLTVSGKLDAETLAALGAVARPEQTLSTNSVASPRAAMAALDLPVAAPERREEPASTARPVAREPVQAPPAPEPETQALLATSKPPVEQPKPETLPVSKDQAMPASAAPVTVARVTEQSDNGAGMMASVTDAPASEPRPEPASPGIEPEPVLTAQNPVSTPAPATPDPAEPEMALSASAVTEPSPQDAAQKAEPAPVPAEEMAAASLETAPPTPVRTTSAKSSGGFFSALFDFLFGWLV
ncbi:MAG: peptidoglycan-binding protein [Marinobacter sp.]|uniref:peptidoglycan-binding domain-containing protein n=1 Tax=Marinobacter sp. TaxID=50741 RepID=UPI00299E77FB|nr:peptidoglycan-binding protein [Marinobacter sp.]MDX1635534.1 peptidoglycan-binding protein [Marinobacter sp.]